METDHPKLPLWNYELKMETYPKVRFEPDRLDLGTVLLGHPNPPPVETYLEFYSPATNPHRPNRSSSQVPDSVSVAWDRTPHVETLSGGVHRVRYRLKVGLNKDRQTPGMIVESLRTASANGPASATVTCKVVGPIETAPSLVHFGMMTPGGPPKLMKVTVRTHRR